MTDVCGAQFTGRDGRHVKVEETVRSFREVLDGKHDDLPEQAFYLVGTIEEAVETRRPAAQQLKEPCHGEHVAS